MNSNKEEVDNRPLSHLASNAIVLQSACNLSGVVHSFSRDISRLRVLLTEELGNEFSTDKLNQHSICVLYAEKINVLTAGYYNAGPDGRFVAAYEWCQEACKAD
jgi:hypothetical protein